MSSETSQVRSVLLAQDIWYVRRGVSHDHIRRVHWSTETTGLRNILQKARETPRAVLIQRNAQEADGVLPVHEAKSGKASSRKQTYGWWYTSLHSIAQRRIQNKIKTLMFIQPVSSKQNKPIRMKFSF